MKKFRDTAVGQYLKVKAPDILSKVGHLLPESGVLGIVKNLVDSSTELKPEEKESLNNRINELYELEFKDRDSARNREIEIAKTGHHDFLFTTTGIVGLSVFVFIVYAIIFLEVPDKNKEIFIHLIGIAEGVVLSIFGYYFGSAVKKNIQ